MKTLSEISIKLNVSFTIWIFIIFGTTCIGQTTYKTIADGVWLSESSWDASGIPPSPLLASDSIIIRHDLTDADQSIRGVLVIESGASFVSTSDLEVGENGINLGKLVNYGTISIRNLKVKPGNGCTPTDTLPVIHNFGQINTSNNLHIGHNNGAGAFYNHIRGTVTVNNQIHLDNYLYNEDTMYVLSDLRNHGGTIDGCGYIETPYLDIDENTSRPGTFRCINICTGDGSSVEINIDGSDYADLADAYNNASSEDIWIDTSNTFICSFNVLGEPLPIELLSFEAKYMSETYKVRLKWVTATEINNDLFTIERSQDGINWQTVSDIDGAGNSSKPIAYSAIDSSPYSGISYYRLKQTDFNGKTSYSQIVSIKSDNIGNILIFPNPTLSSTITIKGKIAIDGEIKIEFYNLVGQRVYTKMIQSSNNLFSTSIDVSRSLPVGIYLVIGTGNYQQEVFRQKLVVR